MTRRAAMATAVLAVGAALLTSSCGGADDEGAGADTTRDTEADSPLRVEATEGPRGTELIVYVIGADANTARAAGGRRKVELRCFDKGRALVVRKAHRWPFTDTDNGLTDAHVHQRVSRAKASQVSRCELGGTRGPLSGEVTSTGFQ